MWPCTIAEPGPVSDGFYDNHTQRLGPFDIRIVHLHRGSGKDVISCTLERRPLPPTASTNEPDERPQQHKPGLDCTTLSYQWGKSTSNLRTILCNGADFLVTANLYAALVHLRRPDSDLTLWIDALCIDQENNAEKGNQVQRMGEIYRRSKGTIIWLGAGGFLSREAFRACSKLAMANRDRDGSAPVPQTTLTRPWGPYGVLPTFLILLLLRRSYFNRVWIIQEVALSRNIEIACGSARISWRDFTIGAATVLLATLGSKTNAGIGNILVARALLPWAVRAGSGDSAWIFQTLAQPRIPQTKNILRMAILFRCSNATDPVDKVFSLLGLCEQIQAGSTYGILPMYSRNDPDHRNRVYVRTARTILFAQDKLQLFSAISRPQSKTFDFLARFFQRIWFRTRPAPSLPTWVPDWSETGVVATPLSLVLAHNDNTSAWSDQENQFLAYQLSSHPDSPNFWLCGRFVDDIVDLSEVCNTEKSQSSIWFSIRYCFTMSENHRLETFGKWEMQFRASNTNEPFWQHFISTITCGSNNTYDEDSIMRLLADFRSRSPRNLPRVAKSCFACLFVLPLAISTWTGSGIIERILIYWCFPVVAISSMWYWCFQLVPQFMFQQGWQDHGVSEGFLKADFDHIELRRLARLRSGSLALVPEATSFRDQVWKCKAGIVPLVLRPNGDDFEMVGECYSAKETGTERAKSADCVIRLI